MCRSYLLSIFKDGKITSAKDLFTIIVFLFNFMSMEKKDT